MNDNFTLFNEKDLKEFIKQIGGGEHSELLSKTIMVALDSKAYFMLQAKDDKIYELENKIKKLEEIKG